jgi:hypothetical protein
VKEHLELDHEELCTIIRYYLRSRIYSPGSLMDSIQPEIVFFVDHLTPEGEPLAVKPRVEVKVRSE